jgi:hypothetical protein
MSKKRVDKNKLKYFIDALLFVFMIGIILIGFVQGLFLAEGPVADISKKYFLGLHAHQWGHIHFYISIAFTLFFIIHLILSWGWIKAMTKKIFKKSWKTALVGIAVISLLIPLIFWSFSTKNAEKYAGYGAGGGRDLGRSSALSEKQVKKETDLAASQQETPVINVELSSLPKKEQPSQETAAGEETAREESHLQEGRGLYEERQRVTRGRLDEHGTGILITGQMTLLELEKVTGIPKSTILKEMGLPADIPYSESLGRLRRRFMFTMQELRDKIEALMIKK